MSHIAAEGEQSTSLEILTLTNLAILPVSGTGQFLRKTGLNTFENATPAGSGTGTVTSVSIVSANGFAGTVANDTTTPEITLTTTITGLLKGNGTAISAATDGTDYLSSTTGLKLDQTSAQTITNDSPIFNILTASELLATDENKKLKSLPVSTYPSLTEISYVKGVTSSIQSQFSGKADNAQTFYIGTTQVAINRGSAALTLAGLTLTTPNIGIPSAGVLTNCTGLPVSGLANGTEGQLITWGANGAPATVEVGTAGQVLTSNGVGAAPTFQTAAGSGDISGSGTANELAYFTAEKTIDNLPVATYPSLTEVSYVKGVTSAIQTQLNGKQDALGFTPEDVANKKTSITDSDTDYPTGKAVKTALDGKQATGSYEVTTNKETSALDTSTTKYPCNNVVKTAVDAKQDALVSGTNIKTINSESLLGGGNIAITVPTKASGSEVNTGTDDAKYLTAKSVADSDYIKESDIRSSQSIVSNSSITPTGNYSQNEVYITALAVATTINAPSGTPVNGNTLLIRIKDNGTKQNLTWNAIYEWIGVDKPEETTASKVMYIGAIYNSTSSKWEVVSINEE